jgi:hypothetical protein
MLTISPLLSFVLPVLRSISSQKGELPVCQGKLKVPKLIKNKLTRNFSLFNELSSKDKFIKGRRFSNLQMPQKHQTLNVSLSRQLMHKIAVTPKDDTIDQRQPIS